MTYLEILWALKRRVAAGDYPVTGICSEVDLPNRGRAAMYRWPESSGSYQYPVQGVGLSAASAYDAAHLPHWQQRQVYLWCGAYGGRRMRLLNWLIRQEEAERAEQAE